MSQSPEKRPGRHLREWRVAKGLSLRDMAKQCGLSAVEYCNLERGIHAPKVDTAKKLESLGVPRSILDAMAQAGDCQHHTKEIHTVFADWIDQETGKFEGGMQEVLTCVDCGKGFSGAPAQIDYTNYKGTCSLRTIWPVRIYFGANEWHPKPQWLLEAWCEDKQAIRTFSMKDIHSWQETGGTK